MISKKIKIQHNIKLGLLIASLLLAATLRAQDREKYDSIAAKYKNQNAVYTNITERLVISVAENDTELVANSYVTKEKLFISDVSLNTDNYDYCFHSDFHALTDINAVAYLPEGNNYKKVECSTFGEGRPRDYVFYDDNRIIEAIYSGLRKNALTVTKYSIEHTDIHMLEDFFLQEGIPIVNATYEVVAPDYVNISFVLKGENTSWFKQTKEEKNGNTIYRFTATDVPAFKEFEHVPSIRYYMPHIIPFITSYKFPNVAKSVEMLDNTDGLYKYDYKYVRNLNMKLDTPLIRTVKELTRNDVSQRDKAAHIYSWVQKNIHYIAFEKGLEGFVPRQADTVFKRKYGDCKDMASILVAMLNKAGLTAYFTSIGTWDLPYVHDETPVEQLYNHMICALRLGDEWVFLDGTDPALPFGANRPDIQGKEAMIAIDAKNHEVVKIPIEPADKNVTTDNTVIRLGEDKVTGSSDIRYQGYAAWNLGEYLDRYHKKDERDKAVRIITSKGSNKYLVDKYNVKTEEGGNRDVQLSTEFMIGDYARKVDKKCYVNMNLTHTFENFRINEPDRKIGYYHDYKEKIKEVTVLEIPDGYRLALVPKNAKGGVEGAWNYSITYTTDAKKLNEAKTVTQVREYEVNNLITEPGKFADNNKQVDELKKIYKESVVLNWKGLKAVRNAKMAKR